MEALRKTTLMLSAMAAMMDGANFNSDVRYDLRMRKRDPSKPRPDAKKLRKRKLQKQARKQQR